MPRHAIEQARFERNAALVETMLLEAAADGHLSRAELIAVIRRVVERPEFDGTHSEDLTRLVEDSAARLAASPSLDHILESLKERLPGDDERRLAFGLAVSVAFADKRSTRGDTGVLKIIQLALDIAEEDVSRITAVIENGGLLSAALGDSVERLCAEAMVLVTAADGEFHDEAARDMVEGLLSEPSFCTLSRDDVRTHIARAVQALVDEGLNKRLAAMARGLSVKEHRRKAYSLALLVARSGEGLSAAKEEVLSLLQNTFQLSDDEVSFLRAH